MITRLMCVCSFVLLFVVSGDGVAQETSNLMQVITVKVRPGTESQFEQYVRAVREASEKQGLKNYWLSSQSVSGEPMYTFNIAHGGGWADLGSPGPELVKAFGQKEADRLAALAQSSIESVHTAFYQSQPDLSVTPPQPLASPPAAVLYYWLTLKPGMMQQYQDGSKKTREASLAVTPNSYYIVQTPQFGATSVRVIGLIQKWGDIGTTPGPQQRVTKHFGADEGGKIVKMVNDTIANIAVELDRTRPDLNYQPKQD